MVYIISDLTRFKDSDEVCIAILGAEDGICRRPLPYKNRNDVNELSITPGQIFEADLIPRKELVGPHTEDCDFENEVWGDLASEEDFRALLSKTSVDNAEDGFNGKVDPLTRCVQPEDCPDFSIITVRVKPEDISFSFVAADEKKMRINMVDKSGAKYRRLPLADLFFHALTSDFQSREKLEELECKIKDSEEVFVRLGLGRLHESASGKKGYWVQVNGVYPFPGYYDLMGFK